MGVVGDKVRNLPSLVRFPVVGNRTSKRVILDMAAGESEGATAIGINLKDATMTMRR